MNAPTTRPAAAVSNEYTTADLELKARQHIATLTTPQAQRAAIVAWSDLRATIRTEAMYHCGLLRLLIAWLED